MGLYHKYRPKKFDDLLGMDKQVKMLKTLLENGFPHALLLSGPSGCGKTTIARILAIQLGCHRDDFNEINAAETRGIDKVREISTRSRQMPRKKCKVYLVDEAHQLTSEAQDAFLKVLEDPCDHAYFFLVTTNPGKLKPTIHTRSTEVKVSSLAPKEMDGLLSDVLGKEGVTLSEIVVEKIRTIAEGSARKALVHLEQVYRLESEKDQMEALERSESRKQGIALARALFNPRKSTWPEIRAILAELDEEPETVRHILLGYATSVLLGDKNAMYSRAMQIIRTFEMNFFDSRKAGLVAACYSLFTS